MNRWIAFLCAAIVSAPSYTFAGTPPEVMNAPASTLPVAGPIAYNFYDTFMGTLALVSGAGMALEPASPSAHPEALQCLGFDV